MSFILDSFKKFEQTRGLRKALDLLEVPTQSPTLKSVPRWQYVIALILVLNAGFFVFWFRPWQWRANTTNTHWTSNGTPAGQISGTGRPEDIAGPPAPLAQADLTGPPAPLVPGGKEQETSSEIRPGEKEKADLNPAATGSDRAVSALTGKEMEGDRSKTRSVGQGLEASGSSKTAATGTSGQKSAGRHVSENKVNAAGPGAKQGTGANQGPGTTGAALKKPVGSELSKTPTVGTKQGPDAKTSKSQTAATKPRADVQRPSQQRATGGIVSDLQDFAKLETPPSATPNAPVDPKWYELTPDVRDTIPEINVSMLVYSKNPAERWININGSKKKEGQEISSGLKVIQITQNGAIFSYHGQRFFKGIIGD